MLELSNLCHCVQHPGKLTSKHLSSSRNDRKLICKQKWVLRKWCWVSNLCHLCHCVQHPGKLTSMHFWSSRNERKPLCKQKCVLRKCCWVSQKQWMLDLSNLCHCVQHPENLLVGMTAALAMKESHFLSQNMHVFRKWLCGILETVNARAFKHLPLCSASQKTYKSSRNERKLICKQKWVLRKWCWVSETVNVRPFKPFIVFSTLKCISVL